MRKAPFQAPFESYLVRFLFFTESYGTDHHATRTTVALFTEQSVGGVVVP